MLDARRELRILALKYEAREHEHRILLQKCRVERELHIWCQHHYLQPLFVDGELDVFVDDQQSTWLAKVIINPMQTEFAEPWKEIGGEIGLHHCVGHEPRYWCSPRKSLVDIKFL